MSRFDINTLNDCCQTCINRVKFNRRSACKLNNFKTVGCMDNPCEKYEDSRIKNLEVQIFATILS